jgi:hypothetical protein
MEHQFLIVLPMRILSVQFIKDDEKRGSDRLMIFELRVYIDSKISAKQIL